MISNCMTHFNENAQKVPITDYDRNYMIEDTMQARMTTKGLRVMAFSYCDIDTTREDFEANTANLDEEELIGFLERNQTFLALLALEDPLRENIKDSLGYATLSGISMRMISGDNLDTVKAVAVDAGIISMEEY